MNWSVGISFENVTAGVRFCWKLNLRRNCLKQDLQDKKIYRIFISITLSVYSAVSPSCSSYHPENPASDKWAEIKKRPLNKLSGLTDYVLYENKNQNVCSK
jgi:hypothetical protein